MCNQDWTLTVSWKKPHTKSQDSSILALSACDSGGFIDCFVKVSMIGRGIPKGACSVDSSERRTSAFNVSSSSSLRMATEHNSKTTASDVPENLAKRLKSCGL